MNVEQATKITVNAIQLDATLSGETVNLNRVTFWLSELSYGNKWMGSTMSHFHSNDIVATAARIAEENLTAKQLVALATEGN
jgi:hypothetical protein